MAGLIVTRPQEQAAGTISALQRMGHQLWHAPMSSVEILSFTEPSKDTALIVTSRNGAQLGLGGVEDKSRAIFAVGEKTAQDARDMGFSNVTAGDGTGKSLLPRLLEHFSNTLCGFAHLRGEDLAYDVATVLQRQGLNATDHVVYRMRETNWMPPEVIHAMDEDRVSGVLFYSARAAETFENLLAGADRFSRIEGLTAYCLSHRIEQVLTGPWKERKVATVPSEESLFANIAK